MFASAEAKPQLEKDLLEIHSPFVLRILETRYINHGKGKYFLGETFTLADIAVSNFLALFSLVSLADEFKSVAETNASQLHKLAQRVNEVELADYYKNHFIGQSPF